MQAVSLSVAFFENIDCLPPVTWPPCATNAYTSGQVEVGSYADT